MKLKFNKRKLSTELHFKNGEFILIFFSGKQWLFKINFDRKIEVKRFCKYHKILINNDYSIKY